MAAATSCRRIRLAWVIAVVYMASQYSARRGEAPLGALAEFVDESKEDLDDLQHEWSKGLKGGTHTRCPAPHPTGSPSEPPPLGSARGGRAAPSLKGFRGPRCAGRIARSRRLIGTPPRRTRAEPTQPSPRR